MKKISLIILLLLILAGFTSFLVSQDEEYKEIILKISLGTVEKGTADDFDDIIYERVRPGIVLREGEYLKTSENSNATLEIGEDLIKVEEATAIKLKFVDTGGTALSVLSGAILTQVSKLTEGGVFNVNSPSAVAGVRGTSFRFSYNRKTTEGSVIVSDGIVEVGNKSVKNKSVLLNRNQKISMHKDVDPTEATIESFSPDIKRKAAEDLSNEKEKVKLEIYDEDLDVKENKE